MVIQHNLSALNSQRNLRINSAGAAKNLEKLSSGYRVNRAADDAAGLAISEKMRGQIRGLAMATQNAENGISLIQTAEGGLNETHAILQRMRELAVQAANGTYQDEDREQIAKEVQALKSEVDRIASSIHYNGINLLDGSLGGSKGGKFPAGILGSTSYPAGSAVAVALKLQEMGFDYDVDENAGNIDILGAVNIKSLTGTFNGSTASILVTSSNITGGAPQIALQVGDKTYHGYWGTGSIETVDGETVNLGANSCYIFQDENGKAVATLTNLDNTASEPLRTGCSSGVITGIKLEDKGANTELVKIIPSAKDTLIANDHAIYGAMIATEKDQLIFQIGANGTLDQQVGLYVENMSGANLGTRVATEYNEFGTITGIAVDPRAAANDAIKVIDAATNQISGVRADLGALQNRLEHTLNSLGVTRENLQAAESSIRDVDMAKEMMEFTKNNILTQSSQSMLAQANQLPQGVLQLLQ